MTEFAHTARTAKQSRSKQLNLYSALYISSLSLKRSDMDGPFTCHPHTNHTGLHADIFTTALPAN